MLQMNMRMADDVEELEIEDFEARTGIVLRKVGLRGSAHTSNKAHIADYHYQSTRALLPTQLFNLSCELRGVWCQVTCQI